MNQSHPAKFVVVIPARYGSTRLPGKALYPGGSPWLFEPMSRQHESRGACVVATDDERIREVIIDHGGEVCMTSRTTSRTDRVAEVAKKLS